MGLFGEKYRNAKRQVQAVDFGDLEHLSLEILTGNDRPARPRCAGALRHVMVDEFQDVNQVQWKILSHLATTSRGKITNLFCVGDVKQSIYRFRMADPFIFLARRKEWEPLGQVISMQHNYRSR